MVLVEMMLPEASLTVVVTEPSALVVTLVVSVDALLLELELDPLEPVLEAPLPDRSPDATEAFAALIDMLMVRGSGLPFDCIQYHRGIANRRLTTQRHS